MSLKKTCYAFLFSLFGLTAAGPSATYAAETGSEQAPDKVEQLDIALQQITDLSPEFQALTDRYQSLEPDKHLARTIMEARIERTWEALLDRVNTAAILVLDLTKTGNDVAAQREVIVQLLGLVPAVTFGSIDRLSTEIEAPDDSMPAAEQAAIYAQASVAINRTNTLFQIVAKNIKLQQTFELDVTSVKTEFHNRLEERAAAAAAFLDVSQLDVQALAAQLTALPNETEIASRLAVARQRVKLSADSLRVITGMMKSQELDTSLYDAKLISVTGAITTDIFNLGVVKDLLSSAWASITDWLSGNGTSLIFSMLIFIVIVFVTFKIASIVQRLVTSALGRSQVRLSQLLKRMIVSTSRGMIIVIGLLVALSQIGISLGPLLAGLGIAGFVIGFALQDTLSNFASGLMILLYRPFDVKDVVEAGGVFGTVSHMSLVNTTILTFDNQTLVLPNNKIWGDVIKNLTSQRERRVDMTFGVSYSDDVEKTERILTEIVTSHPAVLKDPEPMIHLHELADSSVNFIVRPWVKTDDYWPVYWDVMRAVKMTFDAEGISIPFPQRDVHVYNESAVSPSDQVPVKTKSEPEMQDSTVGHRKEFNDTTAAIDDD